MHIVRLFRFFVFAISITCAVLPAAAQLLPSAEPDPLARIREAAKTNVAACSATGESLCEQIAPKLIAGAQDESSLAENIGRLRDVSSLVAAFRNAGVATHSERHGLSENVVGEIPGRGKPEEWIILGARLDTSGADARLHQEEAENVALVIEVARDIQRKGVQPRRSIRFVIFGGGQDMPGPRAYVEAHRRELDSARAVVHYAAAADHLNGFTLNARRDIEVGLREAMKPLEAWDVGHHRFDAPLEMDTIDFVLEGIPTILVTKRDPAESSRKASGSPGHSLNDSDLKEIKRNTALVAVTVFGIAEDAEAIGPRQSRTDIEIVLKTSGLADRMKAAGYWPQWETGVRGRSK